MNRESISLEKIRELKQKYQKLGHNADHLIVPCNRGDDKVSIGSVDFCFSNKLLQLNKGRMHVGKVDGMDLWVDANQEGDKIYLLDNENMPYYYDEEE